MSRSLKLDFILNTHHHWDHVGGEATSSICQKLAMSRAAQLLTHSWSGFPEGTELVRPIKIKGIANNLCGQDR